ncbi:hypothetical protein BLA29_011492 [Euroglyphus maynei]|uniref:Uncharacterized protein n=1 Tax=Euroglyphus maynei TaxID=6958 RepID=A0A1Y3BCG8_EURMA|nr:hypothetical protein BLA29_011492 [Euroglyphus maynei]
MSETVKILVAVVCLIPIDDDGNKDSVNHRLEAVVVDVNSDVHRRLETISTCGVERLRSIDNTTRLSSLFFILPLTCADFIVYN